MKIEHIFELIIDYMFSFVLEGIIYKNPNRDRKNDDITKKRNKNHEYTQIVYSE